MPASIEDFQLLRVLGNGSFGAVVEAVGKRDKLANRHVAVKMMSKNRMSSDGLKRRVVNEVAIHLRLQHPAVLKLYDCFEDKQYVYLVMELCTAGELDALLRHDNGNRRKLTELQTRRIMQQLVGGLMYLHTHGVLHRDLKPSNILLTKEGQVVEMDRLNEERTLCGTPNYMAPEILARQPYGFASDIWSLGCVFVKMLTGRPPFQGRTPEETLNNICNGSIQTLSYMSPVAQSLAKQLLQRDPSKRISLPYILLHEFFTETEDTHPAPLSSQSHRPPSPPIPSQNEISPLVPINTERLRPLKQKTKHGTVELLEDGRLKLDLLGEPFIMLISGDGQTIEFVEHGTRQAIVSEFTLDKLPAQYQRKYAYASRFVDLVRSRTPKITFFSSQAQCSLMENGPNADFEVQFYDGWKIRYLARRSQLEVTEATQPTDQHYKQHHSREPSREPITHVFDLQEDPLNLTPAIATRFQHARDTLRRCLDAEKQSSSYPVVIRRRSTSIPATNGAAEQLPPTSESPSTTSNDANSPRNIEFHKPTTAHSHRLFTPMDHEDALPTTVFLAHVGWLVRFKHYDLVLFADGTQLRTHPSKQIIYWRESMHTDEKRYALNEPLPVVVSEKLSLLPLLQSLPV
ncbi:kinase-like domain-containing protein [Syncephalis fuscata]|nr:kinase-like domain-containing protein [Syncephalis fuscata]